MPPPFELTPEPIPDDFVWRGKCFHLTYPSHIDKELLMNSVKNATSTQLRGWSACHESKWTTDPHTEEVSHYDHTHFALIFQVPINLQGSRKFDVYCPVNGQYHPNVQRKLNMTAMECLFNGYHRGRKYSIEIGKMIYEAPVWLEQKLPPEFQWTEELINEIKTAATLSDACIVGSIRPRSVTDVRALRDDDGGDQKRFQHLYPASDFLVPQPAQWTTVWAFGPSGMGKTKCFSTWFNNPCFIKPFDSIGCVEAIMRKFNPKVHDGIVLDEADLRFLSRSQAIAFVDADEEFEMDVRFKSFTMPRGIKKILISNPPPDELIPPDPHGAIMRRITVLHINAPTYAPPALQPPQQRLQVQATPAIAPATASAFTPVTQANLAGIPPAMAGWQQSPPAPTDV